jgi:hypothetical protein
LVVLGRVDTPAWRVDATRSACLRSMVRRKKKGQKGAKGFGSPKQKSTKALAAEKQRGDDAAAGKTRDKRQEVHDAAATAASLARADKSGVEGTSVNDRARTAEARHGA